MQELQARMAETARGFNDQHLNAEAMADLLKQQELDSPLDAIEKAIQQGDVAAAMRSLDQLSAQLDRLASGLEKTADLPDARQRALMQEMLAFKDQLEKVERQQQETAAQTEQVKNEVRRRLAPKLEEARQGTAALEQLAREARQSLDQAQPGVPPRGEPDLDAAREALADLQRALSLHDLEAATEQAARAQGPTKRLGATLEEDAALAQRFPGAGGKTPAQLEAAQAQVKEAAPRIARIRERLARLTPDATQAMTPADKQKLAELAGRQQGLERQAGELQQKLAQLSEKAPIFPPQAQGLLGESRGHMGSAAGELQGRNPQRGHGEQQAALESLGQFKKGLEQMAKQGKGGSGGFPFPFGETGGGGEREGEGVDPAQQKVVIPGSEAHRLPEEFRRDLLEAMKQGAPERYRGEVQRYYEELVK
jgi:DNA repair exonuclease SbcCD ATPase subunit